MRAPIPTHATHPKVRPEYWSGGWYQLRRLQGVAVATRQWGLHDIAVHGFSSGAVGRHVAGDDGHLAWRLPCANCVFLMERLQMDAAEYSRTIKEIPDRRGRLV